MNGHPVRQPGGVVVGRDENGKSATVDESAVGRYRTLVTFAQFALVFQQAQNRHGSSSLLKEYRTGDRHAKLKCQSFPSSCCCGFSPYGGYG